MPGEPTEWLGPSDLIEPLSVLLGDSVTVIDNWSCAPIAGGTRPPRRLLPTLPPTMPDAA